MKYDITRLKTSWTRYSVVQNLDLLYDRETLISFVESKVEIDIPVVKAFLGVTSLEVENIPQYWFDILKFPNEKKLFGMFSLILTHFDVIEIFKLSSISKFGGTLNVILNEKKYTNIRSCLVESGATTPIYRKEERVPFDFSPIFKRKEIGPLFRSLLIDRLNKISLDIEINSTNYYVLIEELQLYKCFGCDSYFFKEWLENDYINTNNEKYPYLKEVKINNFYCIEDEIVLDLENSKEIYFVGENGDGKSLILMAMYLAFNKNYIFEFTDQEDTGKIRDIDKDNINLILSGKDTNNNSDYLNNFFSYGTHRGRFSSENYEKNGFMSLFDSNEQLINPEQWIKDQALLNIDNVGVDIDRIKTALFEILDKTVNIELKGTELIFEEKNRKELKFDQLSEGFKSITIFVIDLLFRLKKITEDNSDIFKTAAVVLVDEIDLHLHPKWKKTIVSKLRSIFVNIQFIFTTHSPTIIQGASNDAIIFRVFRNEEGVTCITDKYYRKDLNSMMLNTLVTSSLFDLESARLDESNDVADTSDNFLLSKIYKKVNNRLKEQKREGKKKFISPEDIDRLIEEVLEEFNND